MTRSLASNTAFEVGDILAGGTFWYRSDPRFFRVEARVGKYSVELQELPRVFDTPYLDNAPFYRCAPLGHVPEDLAGDMYFTEPTRGLERVRAYVRQWGEGTGPCVRLHGRYGFTLMPWHGNVMTGCCD